MRHVYRISIGFIGAVVIFSAIFLLGGLIHTITTIPYIGSIFLITIALVASVIIVGAFLRILWMAGDDIIRHHEARKARKKIEKNHIQ